MIDYRYLNAFLAVAEARNFTEAGLRLGVAQSAVSRQVRLLEESLGKQLFVRTPRQVVLTPEGQELFAQAVRFDGWAQDFFARRPARIRIGTMAGVLENWLLERLSRGGLSEISQLDIRSAKLSEIERGLSAGELDLGLVPKRIDNELISSKRLFKEDFSLISSSGVKLSEIHLHPWIYGESGGYLKLLTRKSPPRSIRVDSVSALLRLVEKGFGIAVLADHMITNKYKLKRVALPKLSGEVYLAQLNYRSAPPHLKAFVATLTE